jgi:beta-N-acetylhexosaminidase
MSWIDKKIATMSIEDKVAQLFVIDLYTVNQTSNVLDVTPSIETFMTEYPVGGIILFSDNVDTANQTKKLISDLQSTASIPLFISIDEEGGLVSRIGSKNIGVDHLPNAATLPSDYSSSQVQTMARTLGQQLASFGINMNFAPVLDVNTNPNNPVIGSRAFSSNPTIVGDYGTAFMQGLLNENILPVGKHFPGHGDTTTDSHLERTSIDHTIDELRRVEWLPFQQAIDVGIPVIMTGHIHTPNITQDDLPASLSKAMTTDYLREELGFDGVVITDSLRMKAITNEYEASEVGILVLEAGGDLILLPNDFQSCYEGIIKALDSGRLTEERVDLSLRRLFALKNELMENLTGD